MPFRIGVIADTHGLLHERVADVFAGVDHILHAGDIGGAHILRALQKIAPVTSVDGNNDDATGEEIERVEAGGLRVLLTHILPRPQKPAARVVESLRKKPADFVVFGHSHLPHHEGRRHRVLQSRQRRSEAVRPASLARHDREKRPLVAGVSRGARRAICHRFGAADEPAQPLTRAYNRRLCRAADRLRYSPFSRFR